MPLLPPFSFEGLVNDIMAEIIVWAQAEEARALKDGVALTPAQLEMAREIGIGEPGKVRVLVVPEMPPLPEAVLGNMSLSWIRPEDLTRHAQGLALGYGVFIKESYRGNSFILAHELAHVFQHEQLGGMEPFLKQYIQEMAGLRQGTDSLDNQADKIAEKVTGAKGP